MYVPGCICIDVPGTQEAGKSGASGKGNFWMDEDWAKRKMLLSMVSISYLLNFVSGELLPIKN